MTCQNNDQNSPNTFFTSSSDTKNGGPVCQIWQQKRSNTKDKTYMLYND